MLPQSLHGSGCPGPVRTRPHERVRHDLAAAARAREGGTEGAMPAAGGSLGDGVIA
ncbi:hypothetical protein [Streptomyces sp. UNOB3_S3]|uniref:hypothetical protein n=1 Tax=Streptomyces sp. UNOB3_S3 TaxID=2871682 RepID=UPI001E3F7703|nr:hypothetical protein [Streptomyces sp. UNOB3_S3]MCC3777677.1 hypothetical protein [Streptomyces sp. UNOB3_S3]